MVRRLEFGLKDRGGGRQEIRIRHAGGTGGTGPGGAAGAEIINRAAVESPGGYHTV